MGTASTPRLLALGMMLLPGPPSWEVIRSQDGDFACSMPAKPTSETRKIPGPAGTLEALTYSCLSHGSRYLVQRNRSPAAVAPERVIAELARRKKGYFQGGARLVKEAQIVVDGVIGDDFTYIVPSPRGDGDVTGRTRHFLTGHFYYVLTVISPPGRPLPGDATRFLSSLTFEALVNAHYARVKAGSRPAAGPQGGAPGAVTRSQAEGKDPRSGAKVMLADSTPEDALRTFFLALAAQDEVTLRAVTLPDEEFDWLLTGRPAPPELLARMRAQLAGKPMRRLKTGDRVRMPNGESRVIKPDDVRAGRVVLWPDGAPLPSRLEQVSGRWKVFARPFIAARKSMETQGQRARPKSPGRPRGPER